jgi:bifunctional non-homologous end joining protein LigD
MTPRAKSRKAVTASDAVEQQLKRYREMRDFSVTAEPRGGHDSRIEKKSREFPFVIQKHAATRLHYDFRLGWNGVLKSWAIAKGPSYYPADKRLAVQVEDHPMEYGGFEGIIPKGQYGGGTVMVWDQGTWSTQPGHEDFDEGLRSGSLKFILHGSKLQGKWALVRMGGKAANESKPNWLLIKEHDECERGKDDPPITEEAPNSAVTGRSIEEIAAHEDHVWNSKETAGSGKAWYRQEEKAPTKGSRSDGGSTSFSAELHSFPAEQLPAFIEPQLAQLATTPSDETGWIHELKLDGYRIQARKDGNSVQLLTRTGLDWTHRMKTIATEIAGLPVKSALLDGEVVVVNENGTTSFADLQAAFQERARRPFTYFVFDLLHLEGHNLRGLPLLRRKKLLKQLVGEDGEWLRVSDHVEGRGETVLEKACELQVEGIISKRRDAPYTSGRGSDWQKFKCVQQQEFVVGGFTLSVKESHGIGALLLGYYDRDRLVYAGRCGTGFNQKSHRLVRDRLEALRQSKSPFESVSEDARGNAIWVKPELVVQVHFANWTADDLLRQASFQGIREDKPAKEVHRDEAVAPSPKRRQRRKTVKGENPLPISSDVQPALAIRLTHADEVLDKASGMTKQQLAQYYFAIAPHMLPHIEGRPLSLVRCPKGSGKPCFFQRHKNQTLPEGIESVAVTSKKTGNVESYITLTTQEALAGLAQMRVLEIHPWGSRNEDPERPDRIIIDLDPDPEIPWKTLAASAEEVREAFHQLGFESFLKLTGGKGFHVVVPIEPREEWPEVKSFVHQFVLAVEQRNPSLYLTKMSKAARKGRIYLDYLRNERGATAVAPFSPRAHEGAPVSLPLSWKDLDLPERPVFRVAEFDSWKSRLRNDPWKEMPALRQKLALNKRQLAS